MFYNGTLYYERPQVGWDDNYVYLGYVDFEMPLRQRKAEVKSAVEYRDQVWAAALELEYTQVYMWSSNH